MKNKNVGFLIIGIAIVIVTIVLIFNSALRNIVGETCTHGPTCTMYDTISVQTWISLSIAGLIFIIGLFLVFSKEKEKIVVKTIKGRNKKIDLDKLKLDKEEKEIVRLLIAENGAIFQSTLMEKLQIGKVKTTRLLDKLEAKQITERKRRGMNNIVVSKKQ